MKKILLLLAALAAAPVLGQTSLVRWELRVKGDPAVIGSYTTQTACDTAARARNITAVYECPRVLAVTSAVVCPAAPAPTVATIACPAGTTGSWQQTTTVAVGPAPSCTRTTTLSPVAAPTGACTAVVVTPPSTGLVYYFSDCQAGAVAGCVPGSNANPGTSIAAPKQSLAGFNVNALPAGATLRFARGGLWTGFAVGLDNRNATLAAPITFEAYTPSWGTDSTPAPELRTTNMAFIVGGTYGNTVLDGGYVFRNLKINGVAPTDGSRAFFVHSGTRGVLVEGVEMTNFGIAMEIQNVGEGVNQGMVIRRNNIHHNSRMGILGDANDLLIEDNTIESNNYTGSGFDHGLYLGGHATNGIVRNNRFINNSVNTSLNDGVCRGGNLTVHGQWNGLVIEGNTVQVQRAAPGCWGISVNDGYSSAEFFRNTTIRGNKVENLELGIAVRAAPGVVIENNVIRSNQPSLPSGIVVAPPNGSDDDAGLAPVLRNNVICFTDASRTAANAVSVRVTGGSVIGTVLRTGADALTGACAP